MSRLLVILIALGAPFSAAAQALDYSYPTISHPIRDNLPLAFALLVLVGPTIWACLTTPKADIDAIRKRLTDTDHVVVSVTRKGTYIRLGIRRSALWRKYEVVRRDPDGETYAQIVGVNAEILSTGEVREFNTYGEPKPPDA